MPFGLSGASATFQRMMNGLLQGKGQFVAAYLDNLVVYSETWKEHCHLGQVLLRLRENDLTAKPAKCQFGMRQHVYLGHVMGGGQVHPEPSKLTAVENIPTSTTKKQVRAFLGLTGYYRRFMADYANLAAPLIDLTRKTVANTVVRTPKCEHSFQELKRLFCAAPVLHRLFIAFYPTNRRV